MNLTTKVLASEEQTLPPPMSSFLHPSNSGKSREQSPREECLSRFVPNNNLTPLHRTSSFESLSLTVLFTTREMGTSHSMQPSQRPEALTRALLLASSPCSTELESWRAQQK